MRRACMRTSSCSAALRSAIVGATGNANPAGPHLHFAINRMNPGEKWWQGTPINPYPLLAGKPVSALGAAPVRADDRPRLFIISLAYRRSPK